MLDEGREVLGFWPLEHPKDKSSELSSLRSWRLCCAVDAFPLVMSLLLCSKLRFVPRPVSSLYSEATLWACDVLAVDCVPSWASVPT